MPTESVLTNFIPKNGTILNVTNDGTSDQRDGSSLACRDTESVEFQTESSSTEMNNFESSLRTSTSSPGVEIEHCKMTICKNAVACNGKNFFSQGKDLQSRVEPTCNVSSSVAPVCTVTRHGNMTACKKAVDGKNFPRQRVNSQPSLRTANCERSSNSQAPIILTSTLKIAALNS